MKKILAKILIIVQFVSLMNPALFVHAGNLTITTHAGDTSVNGSTFTAGGTYVKPGEYLRILSEVNNGTAGVLSNLQMYFSNAAGSSSYTRATINDNFPTKFYNSLDGYTLGDNGSGFNPPTQSFGTFPQNLSVGSTASAYQYGVKLNLNYASPTFSPSVYFTANGGVTSGTATYTVNVDVKPHIRSVAFSPSSLPNDNTVATTLTVTVRDWNGCTNLTPGTATVTADLHTLGNGYTATESLTYVSCSSLAKTATFQKTNIRADASATTGANSITITAKDNDGNIGGPTTDTVFWNTNWNTGDVSSQTLTVNNSAGPMPVVDTPPSPATLGVSGSSTIGWHSDKLGTYEVRVGGTSCADGTIISTGSVGATTANSLSAIVPASSLVNGANTIYLCAKDLVNNVGLATTTITKDTTSPTSTISTYSPSTVSSENVSVTWNASEAGTYVIEVNGSSLSSGNGTNVIGSYTAGDIVSVINNSVLQNGTNTIRVKVTDAVGNGPVYSTNSAIVTKDNTPPLPVQSVTLTDCDSIGNTSTPCAVYGNPKQGVTGRDFYINFTLPTATGGIQEYDIYAVLSGQTLTSTSAVLKRVYQSDIIGTSTGIWLPDALTTDSNGNAFISSGTGTYNAIITAFKANGLYSSGVSSSGSVITFDTIVLPVFSGASFTSGTGLTLTYSKALTGTLSKFDSTKIVSASGCFVLDTSSGTGALSVSGSTVTFAVQPLGNIAKRCTDLSVGTGAITDFEGLYSEETLSGATVSDGQIPTPITITTPANNRFVGGSGTFTFGYSFPENMSTGSIVLRFTDNSWAIINYVLPNFSLSGAHSITLTGSTIGLIDGKIYSLNLLANDIAGNAGSSAPVTGFVYDITPPGPITHVSPANLSYLNTPTPTLTWVGSTDNYSTTTNLRYTLEVSMVVDFSSILETGASISGTGFTLATLTTNTGYYWRVKATDQAGNTGSFSTGTSFVFDNTAPVISSLGSDTYIDNTTRSFTGYVKNGDTAVLHAKVTDNFNTNILASDLVANLSSIGGGVSVVPTTYSTGTKLATWAGITVSCADGTKNIPITATDRAGNTGNYTLTVVCDNTAPGVSAATLTSPVTGGYLSGGIVTNITWNTSFYASEASPIASPISLDYSLDGGSNWTNLLTNAANNGSVSWTVPSADIGNAQARIVAKDKLGNTATGTVSFTIDSTNPSVSSTALLSPNGGEFLKGSTGTGIVITWDSGAITDTNIAPNPVSLEYSVNSGSTWSSIATGLANNGSYLWTVPAPAYNSSSVRVRVTATDRVGHTASDSSQANFTIDSTLPTVTVNSPSTPPTASYINNSGFDISAVGADTNIDRVYYSFSYGGNTYWNASGSGSWLGVQNWNTLCATPAECSAINTTIAPGPIVDGTVYTLVLRAIDKAGNFLDSSSYSYTGDTGLPSITNFTQSGSYFSGAVSLLWTGSDIRSGIASLTLQIQRSTDGWYYDGTSFVNTGAISLLSTTSNSYANWSYTGFALPAGDADGTLYVVTTTAIDRAYKINNTTTRSITLIKDATGPTIASPVWANPLWGEIWNGGAKKTLTWNPAQITDGVSGVNTASGISIEYSTGASFVTVANGVANSGSYDWNLPYPLDSSVTLRITARDAVGNLGGGSVSNAFTIDSIPPTITTVETIGDTFGKVSGISVHFSENVNTASIVPSEFTSSLGGAFAPGYTIVSSQIVELLFVSATGTTASAGTLSYSGTSIYDIAGNLLAPVGKSVIDKASPVITSTNLLDSNGNGKIDRIQAYWSEPLSSTTDVTAWTINNPLPGVGSAPTGVSVAGNIATLTLSEPTNPNTSSGGMTLSFVSSANWKDVSVSLNQASSLANSVLVDQAIPIITQIQTFDNSGNYAIDLTFSETITGTLSGFTLSGSSTFSGNITAPSANTLRLWTADSLATDTAKAYTLSYNGLGIYLHDSSLNYVANFTNRSVSDTIAPKILTRTTFDANENGKIDGIRLGFSESLAGTASGVTLSVAGYVVTGYSISGTGLIATLTEGGNADTSATPLVQFQNSTLADTTGNIVSSESVGTAASDAVGPVVTGVRFDGINTLYVDASESVSGALSTSSFILSGATATISSVNFPSGSNSGTITLSSSSIIAGTTELSFSGNSVGDLFGNKQSLESFTKVAATVIINEVMWSGTGVGTTQYIELRNLGGVSIDISGWKIDNAVTNGTAQLVLPANQTIAGNGYYLITATPVDTASNLLANTLQVHFSGALSLDFAQTGNLILRNSGDIAYDRVKVNPWPMGDINTPASMERKSSIGDGLQSTNWYTAQTGTGFEGAWPLGTPGSPNVFDATAPTITSFTPEDNTLYPAGNITLAYAYSDSGGISVTPTYTFLLEKNNGSGGYGDVTNTSLASSGVNASLWSFVTNTLSYGQYRATFTISDAAGNIAQQVSTFYVDAPHMTISTGSYAIGVLSPNEISMGIAEMTVTIETLGAGFRLSLGGDGVLDAGTAQIGAWNGTTGYGMDYAATGSGTIKGYDGTLTAVSGAILEDFATGSYIGGNGNIRTFTYVIKYGAKISPLQVAGNYTSNTPVNLSLQY